MTAKKKAADPKREAGNLKPGMHCVPPVALIYMGMVMQNGADKYGRVNWRYTDVKYSVYLNAAFRHLLQMLDGEETDPDSGLPHFAHVMACMAIIADARQSGTLEYDMGYPGEIAEVLKYYTKKPGDNE